MPAEKKPSLRDEQRNFTRTRLIETACRVISERGFADATVGEIAELANASRATFYLHFKDKHDLIEAVRSEYQPDVETYYRRLDDALASGHDDALTEWMADAFNWFDEHQTIVLALEQAMLSQREPGPGADVGYTRFMPHYLSLWDDVDEQVAEFRVWVLVVLLARVHLLCTFAGAMPGVAREQMRRVLVEIFATTLRPAAAPRARAPRTRKSS